MVLGRSPTPEESTLALSTLNRTAAILTAHLAAQPTQNAPDPASIEQQATARALANLCHALMNSAEFVNVD